MRLVTCRYLALDAEPMVYAPRPARVLHPMVSFSMMEVPQRQNDAVFAFCSAAGAKLLLLKMCSTATT